MERRKWEAKKKKRREETINKTRKGMGKEKGEEEKQEE